MLSKRYLWNDFTIATEQYREAHRERDKTLKALGTCYEALCGACLHGKKEQSMITRIKELNAVLYQQTITMKKLEMMVERAKRSNL